MLVNWHRNNEIIQYMYYPFSCMKQLGKNMVNITTYLNVINATEDEKILAKYVIQCYALVLIVLHILMLDILLQISL